MSVSKGKQVRLLVVDDSAFVRRAIIRMFDGNQQVQVIDVASDGEMAIDMIKKLRPDVVTLDVKMPVLDGLSALERIMAECPVPVVMLSSLTGKGGENTMRALELGAVDFIDKSSSGGPMEIAALASELSAKVLTAARVDLKKIKVVDQVKPESLRSQLVETPGKTEVLLIGTSTGGPPALQAILSKLPGNFPCPILIVQHMPVGFTASLAERLNRICEIRVKEGEDKELVSPGTAYIAPAGVHMKIERSGNELRINLDTVPVDTLHKPSVDVLLESAAVEVGKGSLAFVLTGMGRDGAQGAREIKNAGGRVVVEAEETAMVFGMPKAVMELVRVDAVAPLYNLADVIMKMI
jgi:two-component system chemotaxis response regulator CheB